MENLLKTVITDDGNVLNFLIDEEEKSIEVDEQTKENLNDATFLEDKDYQYYSRTNTYITWYFDWNSKEKEQVENILKTRLK
jgi:hypothetical protein